MAWRLPAEWEPQDAVWMVWPRDPLTWPEHRLEGARAAYLEAVRAIAPGRVELVVHPDLEKDVRGQTGDLDHVRIHPCVHQDSWIRDYGPITVVDDEGGRRFLKFRFDAWGGKYEGLMADEHVVPRLVQQGALSAVETLETVLEGGAVETDGRGTFLATRSVAAARGQTPEEHEAILQDHVGARKVLWLQQGIQGDDTDGHIDTIARFVAPGRVAVAVAPPGHPDHDALRHNRERLDTFTDARGRALEVQELPVPAPQTAADAAPLPAGYANFLITDHAVLLPSYGCPADTQAASVVQECFPRRKVVPIDHRDLIWGFGGIHCLSMQVPRA